MAESKKRVRKLSGAVLIMVVTIMFVLIIMLLATLTVVANVNKRTVTKFEENQAYYTARSTVEVYIDEFLENEEKYASSDVENIVKGAWENNGFTFDTDAQNLVDNLSNKKDFKGEDATDGFIHQQEIFGYLTPKYCLDSSVIDADGKIPADISGDENWVDTSSTNNKYYVEFEASLPDITSKTTDASGKDSVGVLDSDGKVTVRIELLRMVYRTSDSELLSDGKYKTTNADLVDGTKIKMSKINWDKTVYRLKVSATSSISNGNGGYNDSTVSVLLEPSTQASPTGFDNAMTSIEDTTNPAKVFTIGGASATSETYNIPNNSVLTGRYVYDCRQVYMNTPPQWYMAEGTSFVVYDGVLTDQNGYTINGSGNYNETNSEKINLRPYLYTSGMGIGQNTKIGTASGACDIIVSANSAGNLKNYYYTMPNDVSDDVKNDMALAFGGSGNEVYGDVYCDGNMYIAWNNPGGVTFHGKVYCTGDIYVGSSEAANFLNGVVVGGTVKYYDWNRREWTSVEDDSVNYTKFTSKVTGTYTSNDLSTASCDWSIVGKTQNADGEVEINLPGKGTVNVPTTTSTQSEYRDDAGDLIPAEEMYQATISKDTASLSVASSAPKIVPGDTPSQTVSVLNSDGTVKESATTSGKGKVIDPTAGYFNNSTGMYEFKMDFNANEWMNGGGTFVIDASKGNVQIQITGDQQNAGEYKFIVVGDGMVAFTSPDNSGTVRLKNMQVYTAQIYDMLQNNKVFNLGERGKTQVADTPKAPNIYYYFGKNTTFSLENGGNSVFCGYMYGPEASVSTNNSGQKKIKYTYNELGSETSPITPNGGFGFFGSMVFGKIYTQNEMGVVYIAPNSGGQDSMFGTNIIWKRQRYYNG